MLIPKNPKLKGVGRTRGQDCLTPSPSPEGRGVICEVTPIGLLVWGVGRFFFHAGDFFLSQSARRSRRFLAHVSSPQKASGIQSSQSVTANVGTNKGHNEAYILFIGVSW